MGNTLNVLESGTIQCACGGKVTLSSTVPNTTIGGKKPLYWKDILNAPVACPRSPKQNPCTKVVSISSAGTESNVGDNGEAFLLRTDGFQTDKGRAVVLIDPGQSTSKIKAPPSVENEEVEEDEPIEVEEKKNKENIHKEKYSLYLLRKSEEHFRAIRPSRAFRDSKDKMLHNGKYTNLKSIHTHTLAFIYMIQNGKTSEFKVCSRGGIYTEKIKEIFFQNTKTHVIRNDIPLLEDDSVDIHYSNLQIIDKADVKKLPKVTINPKAPDKRNSFYIKDVASIDKIEVTKEDIEEQKKYVPRKDGKQTRKNVLVFIEDIIGEIEDMYEQYNSNYKHAYNVNSSIIEDIKEKNTYTYTVANYLDYYYVSKTEQDEYDKNIEILSTEYKKLLNIVLKNPTLSELILESNNVSTVIEKASSVALSYFNETIYIKKDFFKSIVVPRSNSNYFSLNGAVYANKKYKSYYESSRSQARGYIKDTNNYLDLISTNTKISELKDEPSYVMSLIIFSLFFSLKYEDKLEDTGKFDEIHEIRKKFYFTLKNTQAMPQISEDNIRDVKKLLSKQSTYLDMFSRKDKLISEYDNLEHDKKINSFNYSGKKIDYKSLYFTKGSTYFKGIHESPEAIIKKIAAKLQDAKLLSLLSTYSKLDVIERTYVVTAMNIIYMLHAPRTKLDEESNQTSPFSSEHKKLLDFMSDLTRRRKALEDEDKKYIEENYGIHEAYNHMTLELIGHAFLAQDQKRKSSVEGFLNEFKAEKLKYDLILPNLLDNTYDEEFKAKGKIEDLYETLKAIDGVSSKVGDAIDTYLDSDIRRDSNRKRKIRKIIKVPNTAIKGLSFLVAGANTANFILGKEKVTVPSVISLVNDVSSISHATSKGAEQYLVSKDSKTPITYLQKVFSKENAKVISKGSEKVIALLGIPMLLISTAFDVEKLVKQEDYDASFFTLAKNLMVLSLLLTPTVVGFATIVIIEIAWHFLSHNVLDSNIERYVKNSLFYKEVDFSIFKAITGKEQKKMYQSTILSKTLESDKNFKDYKGFNKPLLIKNFIGDNYDKNNDIFDISLKNELNQIKTSLFGYKIEHLNKTIKKPLYTQKNGVVVKGRFNTSVKIDPELIKNSIMLVSINGEYKSVNAILSGEDYVYDFTRSEYNDYDWSNKGNSEIVRLSYNDCNIILSNKYVTLKYNVTFKIEYETIGFSPLVNLKIHELKEELLTVEDYNQMLEIG